MIDVVGKMFEKLMRSSLVEAISAAGKLSPSSLVLEQKDPHWILSWKFWMLFNELTGRTVVVYFSQFLIRNVFNSM